MQGATVTVVQTVLAAACRPLLAIAPVKRTATDVENLAELLAGLEVWTDHPLPVNKSASISLDVNTGGHALLLEQVRSFCRMMRGCCIVHNKMITAVHCVCLQAFKLLPESVLSRLAKNCHAVQLPAGAVVFKEDQKGDAM